MSKATPTNMSSPMGLFLIWEKFNPPQDVRPSFKDQTIIITGANTGVGFEAAIKFVENGAKKVILGVRSLKKGEDARAKMEERTGIKGNVEVWQLDMLNYDSIQAFAKRATDELDRLDIAVLNAGISSMTYSKSTYGHEMTLQVNVLSTTLLGLLLLPKLKSSKTATCTPVLELISSSSHTVIYDLAKDGNAAPLEIYDRESTFSAMPQYSVSKLFLEYAHIALTKIAKDDVFVTSVCPGATRSNLASEAKNHWHLRLALFFLELVQRTAEEGSRTYITGTTMGVKAQGRFIRDDKILDPAPMLQGEKGSKAQAEVWSEIVEALKKDVPGIDQLIAV